MRTAPPHRDRSHFHHSLSLRLVTVQVMTARGVIPHDQRARLQAAADGVAAAGAELHAAVLAAWQAGGSVREIADELGKSTRTIQDWIRRGEQ